MLQEEKESSKARLDGHVLEYPTPDGTNDVRKMEDSCNQDPNIHESLSPREYAEFVMVKIYSVHNPEKIASIPALLEKYKGYEYLLAELVASKYTQHDTSVIEQSSSLSDEPRTTADNSVEMEQPTKAQGLWRRLQTYQSVSSKLAHHVSPENYVGDIFEKEQDERSMDAHIALALQVGIGKTSRPQIIDQHLGTNTSVDWYQPVRYEFSLDSFGLQIGSCEFTEYGCTYFDSIREALGVNFVEYKVCIILFQLNV